MENFLQDRIEPTTQTPYEVYYNPYSDDLDNVDERLTLGGVGLRKRWWRSIYSYGLYFQEKEAHKELHKWNSYELDELITNLSFYNAIMYSKFGKAVKITLARNIEASELKLAFKEALKDRIKKYQSIFSKGYNQENKRKKINNANTCFNKFINQFDEFDEFEQDTEIIILISDYKLTTIINDEKLLTLEDQSLSVAFLDVYLGTRPVSTGAKEVYAMMVALLFIPLHHLNTFSIQRKLQSRL
eukprot:TRINITY_DN20_c0_g1_i1.p1 TRINITY_DN20_c0_g1~~TRINITY_DN20_c0_g1_i1.p1  ORF type:complete len:243 (-),score=68.09 TRINITY_DN20_c0_g1_i1:79-807(-)